MASSVSRFTTTKLFALWMRLKTTLQQGSTVLTLILRTHHMRRAEKGRIRRTHFVSLTRCEKIWEKRLTQWRSSTKRAYFRSGFRKAASLRRSLILSTGRISLMHLKSLSNPRKSPHRLVSAPKSRFIGVFWICFSKFLIARIRYHKIVKFSPHLTSCVPAAKSKNLLKKLSLYKNGTLIVSLAGRIST
jgi:hypothetical protein